MKTLDAAALEDLVMTWVYEPYINFHAKSGTPMAGAKRLSTVLRLLKAHELQATAKELLSLTSVIVDEFGQTFLSVVKDQLGQVQGLHEKEPVPNFGFLLGAETCRVFDLEEGAAAGAVDLEFMYTAWKNEAERSEVMSRLADPHESSIPEAQILVSAFVRICCYRAMHLCDIEDYEAAFQFLVEADAYAPCIDGDTLALLRSTCAVTHGLRGDVETCMQIVESMQSTKPSSVFLILRCYLELMKGLARRQRNAEIFAISNAFMEQCFAPQARRCDVFSHHIGDSTRDDATPESKAFAARIRVVVVAIMLSVSMSQPTPQLQKMVANFASDDLSVLDVYALNSAVGSYYRLQRR